MLVSGDQRGIVTGETQATGEYVDLALNGYVLVHWYNDFHPHSLSTMPLSVPKGKPVYLRAGMPGGLRRDGKERKELQPKCNPCAASSFAASPRRS